MLHQVFAVEVELIAVVVGISAELGRYNIHRLHTRNQTIVEQAAVKK